MPPVDLHCICRPPWPRKKDSLVTKYVEHQEKERKERLVKKEESKEKMKEEERKGEERKKKNRAQT